MTNELPLRASDTAALASYFSGLPFEAIPNDVLDETRLVILDTLGCVIAARGTEIGPVTASLAECLGAGELGEAYAVARLANAMDLDEGTPSGSHFGCGAIGAALALARRPGTLGREFLASVAIGYEIGGRISEAIGPYFKTSAGAAKSFADVWGVATPVVFAAVGAACRSLRHDAAMTAQAYGSAGSATPVPIGAKWAGETDLPNTKYCDAGWCALVGVFGARSAMLGSSSLGGILDGRNGLLAMVAAQNPRPEILTADLGSRWRIRQVLYKKWPCCRWIHYPLTALAGLVETFKLTADEIEEVVAGVGFAATSARFANQQPDSFTKFQFSIPHAVAMLLLDVPPGPAWLCRDLALHPRVRELRSKVRVVEHHTPWQFPDFRDGAADAIRRMSSGVHLAARGRRFVAETDFAFGDSYSELRWGEEEVIEKFRSLVAADQADRIIDALWNLDAPGALADLLDAFDLARPAASPGASQLSSRATEVQIRTFA